MSLLASFPLVSSHAWAALTPSNTTATTPVHKITAKAPIIRSAVSRAELGHKNLPIMRVMTHGDIPTKQAGSKQVLLKGGKAQYSRGGNGGMQCVPFARAASGIQLKGNAVNWWDAANGVYARGQAPEQGSVLNFRANGHMRLGHVAVVTHVVSSREIEIDHANWSGPGANKGRVARGMSVIDVSPSNDWSAVRVSLGEAGSYGSVYSTYGFIYDRPDNGTFALNQPAVAETHYDEVAEAPTRSLR